MLHEQPGRQTVLDRLLDVLVVYGLRAGLDRSPTPPAWFRAASDLDVWRRCFTPSTLSPKRTWTVDELARRAHMLRATFARTFQRVVGQTPMKYLTGWRMTLAGDLLLTSGATLEQIASRMSATAPCMRLPPSVRSTAITASHPDAGNSPTAPAHYPPSAALVPPVASLMDA